MGYGDRIPLSLLRAYCLVFWVAEKDVTSGSKKGFSVSAVVTFFGACSLNSKSIFFTEKCLLDQPHPRLTYMAPP